MSLITGIQDPTARHFLVAEKGQRQRQDSDKKPTPVSQVLRYTATMTSFNLWNVKWIPNESYLFNQQAYPAIRFKKGKVNFSIEYHFKTTLSQLAISTINHSLAQACDKSTINTPAREPLTIFHSVSAFCVDRFSYGLIL